MEKVISVFLVVLAAFTLWAVLTNNNAFVG